MDMIPMNKQWKETLKFASAIIIGVVVAWVGQSFSSKDTDNRQVEEELKRLDRIKANYEYVDQKCNEIKNDATLANDKLFIQITEINRKTDEMYKLIVEMSKK